MKQKYVEFVPNDFLPLLSAKNLRGEYCRNRDLFYRAPYDTKLIMGQGIFYDRGVLILDELKSRGIKKKDVRSQCPSEREKRMAKRLKKK